ncbi:hypothetical protein MTO96_006174 [Rhipicephalus appendiculatus]
MAVSFAQNGAGSSVFEPYRNGDISCVGHDCRSIPDRLVHAYAFAAYRLDLSYNRLTTIQGIEHFVQARHFTLALESRKYVRLKHRKHRVFKRYAHGRLANLVYGCFGA